MYDDDWYSNCPFTRMSYKKWGDHCVSGFYGTGDRLFLSYS